MARRTLERVEILGTLRKALPELRERYGVRTLALFGSYAHGQARKGSDVDLLVEFDVTPSLLKFIELEQHLSRLLGARVDLVMKRALKPAIGQRILSEVEQV